MESNQEEIIYNEILPNSQEPGFSSIYRQKGLTKFVTTPNETILTVRDIVQQCKDKFSDKHGFGT
jgi:hypothetical protein